MNFGDIIIGLAGIVLGASQVKKGIGTVTKGQKGEGLGVLGPARQGGTRTPPTQIVQLSGNRYSTLSSPPIRAAKSEMKTKIRGVNNLDDRMAAIIEMGHRGKSEPAVVEWARNAVTQRCGGNWCTPEKDTLAEIRAIYGALRQDIRYTSDIRGLDTYANPKHTLRMRSGDCDDYASLGFAALASVGIPVRYKVIRTVDSEDWNHIYIQAGTSKSDPKSWISLDASVPAQAGWEAPANMVAESRIYETE